jgi:nucleoside-diphosphate-sugar epimerase
MKIAVLGCGWLGLPLAKNFVELGNAVIGTTTSSAKLPALKEAGIVPKVWNLGENFIEESLKSIDVLILNIPPSKTNKTASYSDSLVAFCNGLEPSTKVIFISTTGVYPNDISSANTTISFDEMDQSKETVLSEIKLTRKLNDNLTILRLAGLIGPNRHPITSLSKKGLVKNSETPLNLIHLDDAIGLIHKIINEKYWGKIINGCYPENPTKKEYYTKAAHFFKLPPPNFEEGGIGLKKVESNSALGYAYKTSIYEFNKI